MIEFLLKLFGVKIDGALKVVSVGLEFRNGGAIGWVILLGFALAGLAWWTYRGGDVLMPSRNKRLLIGLRTTLFILILLILLRPVISFTIEGNIRRLLIGLFDTSASLAIKDPRTDPMDTQRAARYYKGDDPNHAPRLDLVKAVLQDSKLQLVPELEKSFDLQGFGFGQSLTRLQTPATEWAKGLAAQSPMTAMGDAIRDVLGQKRGQPLGGILLVTDGANNAGMDAMEAATLAKAEGAPLYIYGVGITSPRDIIVPNLFAQEVAFIKDELPVTVRVRGQGLQGEKAHLTLKLGDETVAEKDLEFTGDAEQVVPLSFTPRKTGEFILQASIPPRDDESVKDNNSVSQRLKVIDSKIKVLFIEQAPRWDFRYLQNVLLRDPRVDLKCVLLEGDPAITQGEQSPYLEKFPTTREELFKYDLLIIGDVDPKVFSAAQLDGIGDFVSKFGGSCISIAGKKFNPAAYKSTVIEKLLPVELGSLEVGNSAGPVTLALTPAGQANEMMKASQRESENAAIWANFPPVQWVARVARAKPGAQVLLEDPEPALATRFGKMPVIAFQQYGLGQVLYVGTDNTWRWRKNSGENEYRQLWSRITQRMALAHLLGGAKRTQLTANKQNFTTGESVTVYARLYGEGFEPIKEAVVNGFYTIGSGGGLGDKQEVALRAVPGQPGMYRGEFVTITPGTYRFSVAIDPKTGLEFGVSEPRFELGETALNEPLLKAMAGASGGAFFREEDLPKLSGTITQAAESIRSKRDVEVWTSPFYFLLMLGVVTAEWVLRKRWHLK